MPDMDDYREEYTIDKIADALHDVDKRHSVEAWKTEIEIIMEEDQVDLAWATVAALVENKESNR